jgi:hypothetical protein
VFAVLFVRNLPLSEMHVRELPLYFHSAIVGLCSLGCLSELLSPRGYLCIVLVGCLFVYVVRVKIRVL